MRGETSPENSCLVMIGHPTDSHDFLEGMSVRLGAAFQNGKESSCSGSTRAFEEGEAKPLKCVLLLHLVSVVETFVLRPVCRQHGEVDDHPDFAGTLVSYITESHSLLGATVARA